MAKTSSNFWLGFIIGLLTALLIGALVVLLVPRLRPIIGDFAKTPLTADDRSTLEDIEVEITTDRTSDEEEEEVEDMKKRVTPQTAENVRVTTPDDDDAIDNPVLIKGEARVFEGTVSLRVKDGNGRVLAETFTTANAIEMGVFGPFEISLVYQDPEFDYGSIEIFAISAKDGSEIDKVVIPVEF